MRRIKGLKLKVYPSVSKFLSKSLKVESVENRKHNFFPCLLLNPVPNRNAPKFSVNREAVSFTMLISFRFDNRNFN